MNDLYLVHHGVKGMKWGVRKDIPKRKRPWTKFISFTEIKQLSAPPKQKTNWLPKQEYAHIMHEVTTHASDLQKSMPTFSKPIGNHIYAFKNNFDGTYDIIGKAPISLEAASSIRKK